MPADKEGGSCRHLFFWLPKSAQAIFAVRPRTPKVAWAARKAIGRNGIRPRFATITLGSQGLSSAWKHRRRLHRGLEDPQRGQPGIRRGWENLETQEICLVGGLVAIFYFPIYWVSNHPNWLSYFSEGFKPPPTSLSMILSDHPVHPEFWDRGSPRFSWGRGSLGSPGSTPPALCRTHRWSAWLGHLSKITLPDFVTVGLDRSWSVWFVFAIFCNSEYVVSWVHGCIYDLLIWCIIICVSVYIYICVYILYTYIHFFIFLHLPYVFEVSSGFQNWDGFFFRLCICNVEVFSVLAKLRARDRVFGTMDGKLSNI